MRNYGLEFGLNPTVASKISGNARAEGGSVSPLTCVLCAPEQVDVVGLDQTDRLTDGTVEVRHQHKPQAPCSLLRPTSNVAQS